MLFVSLSSSAGDVRRRRRSGTLFSELRSHNERRRRRNTACVPSKLPLPDQLTPSDTLFDEISLPSHPNVAAADDFFSGSQLLGRFIRPGAPSP
jgi:hypothetical protein